MHSALEQTEEDFPPFIQYLPNEKDSDAIYVNSSFLLSLNYC